MLLWTLAILMTLAVGAMIALPLLRPSRRGIDRAEYDLAIYRDQLAEVDRDLARGVLSPEQADAARTEIKRRILAADAARQKAETATRRPAIVSAAAVGLVLPAGAFGLYLAIGSPEVPSMPIAERREAAAQAAGATSAAQFDEAITQLRKRLEATPDDAMGWSLLARSLAALERNTEAVPAYRRALELAPDNVSLMADLGETLVILETGRVGEEALGLYNRILTLDPGHPAAGYYVGLAAAQQGMAQEAMNRWAAMARNAPAGAEWLPFIEDQMRKLASNSGTALPDDMAAGPGPTREQMEAAQDMTPEERMEMIRSMVEGLEARLAENPDDLAGWQRLARAWQVLGETDKQKAAEAEIARLQAAAASVQETPRGPTREQMEAAREMAPEDRQAMIRQMVEGLAARLEDNPDDLEGWKRLARSWRVLGEAEKAEEAEKRVRELEARGN
jgi:cytochrome c-type biogenesis protein CcmH